MQKNGHTYLVSTVVVRVLTRHKTIGAVALWATIAVLTHYVTFSVTGGLSWDFRTEYITPRAMVVLGTFSINPEAQVKL
jgi:hypothetical protein